MGKTYFFSYGDDNYKQSKLRLEQEAKNFGFDHIAIYGPEDLDPDFVEKTEPYIKAPRGAGFWLWKSHFLTSTFDAMKEGDYCVYVDAGCTVNPYAKDTFKSYLEMLDNDDSGMIRFSYEKTPEEMFTNEKVFEYFNKKEDKEFRNSDILMNGIIVFKKNENSQKYVDEYYRITLDAPEIFSDKYNHEHCERYKDHRHDQSVSSCLVKINGKFIQLDDHSYAPDMQGWMELIHKMKIPFLATRIRG
jgi:hypothetical protein